MLYVGLDIHSKRISLCVITSAGKNHAPLASEIDDQMMRILEGLPDRFEVCYEASCGYGHFHDWLHPVAARVLVAHPRRLRLIFRSSDKNDRKDAERVSSAVSQLVDEEGRSLAASIGSSHRFAAAATRPAA